MRIRLTLTVLALLSGCASSGVVSTGPDSYMIAKTSGVPAFTSGGEVAADLYREANAFCSGQNRQLLTVNATSRDSIPFVRLANAKLEFRCLVEGDPELDRQTTNQTPASDEASE